MPHSIRRSPAGSAVVRLFAVGAALLPTPVQAAAWTLPAGQTQVIATAITTSSEKSFDAQGHAVSGPTYDKSEVYILAERGITDAITVSATPSLSYVSVGGTALPGNGLGYLDLAVRGRLAGGTTAPVSLQATLRIPGNKRTSPISQVAAQGVETDLRALVGRSLTLSGMKGFVDLQAGYRFRGGAPANDFHLDATFGLRPAARVQVLLQSFTVVSDGSGTAGFPANRYANVAGSVVYDIGSHVSLQLGVTGTLAGRNALRERGGHIGLWLRP